MSRKTALLVIAGILCLAQLVFSVGSAASAPTLKVAMAAAGARGDQGIFDSGWAGLVRAQEDLGVEARIFEGKEDPALYYERLLSAAKWADLVFVNPGYQFESELEEFAQAFPKVQFVYCDGISGIELPNISSVAYKENEGSFLFGIMAAMMTTRTEIDGINPEKVVGLVGAMDIPVINNFVAGFKQGVKTIDPSIEVKVLYAGTFSDPAKGKELATMLYSQGADIVYNVAATTGLGVLMAAKETGHYAIGVDINQDGFYPGHVAGSMLKNVDVSFYDVVKSAVEGKSTGSNVFDYGLKEGWVGPTYSDQMKSIVPADIIEEMQNYQEKIVSGQLEVDSTR